MRPQLARRGQPARPTPGVPRPERSSGSRILGDPVGPPSAGTRFAGIWAGLGGSFGDALFGSERDRRVCGGKGGRVFGPRSFRWGLVQPQRSRIGGDQKTETRPWGGCRPGSPGLRLSALGPACTGPGSRYV